MELVDPKETRADWDRAARCEIDAVAIVRRECPNLSREDAHVLAMRITGELWVATSPYRIELDGIDPYPRRSAFLVPREKKRAE